MNALGWRDPVRAGLNNRWFWTFYYEDKEEPRAEGTTSDSGSLFVSWQLMCRCLRMIKRNAHVHKHLCIHMYIHTHLIAYIHIHVALMHIHTHTSCGPTI